MKNVLVFVFLMTVLAGTGKAQFLPPPDSPLFTSGLWAESEHQLRADLNHYPVHPRRKVWLWELSQIYIQQGRLQDSRPLLAELRRKTTGDWNFTISYWLARTYIDYDQFTEGLSLLDSAGSGPGGDLSEHAYLLRGFIHARLGNWETARQIFSGFSEHYPESPSGNYASLSVADCDYHLGQYARAIDQLLLLQPLITGQDEKERSLLIVSESYIRLGLWKDAIISLGRYDQLFPGSFQIDFVRFRLAYALLKENQKNRAMQILDRIGDNSWLAPFKKVLFVELWKESGQIDQILEARLQIFTFSPEINRYNLNHRLWAALKLNRWDLFERDLSLITDETGTGLSLDSLWVQVAQVAVENNRWKEAGRAYLTASGFNKKRQQASWPGLVYNSGFALFKAGKYPEAIQQFDYFLTDYKGHRLEGPAFMAGLESCIRLGWTDSIERRIRLYRDRFVRYYDDIDLIQSENLFRTGKQRTGLALLDKKIRYAASDSVKNRMMFSAAKMTLDAGRPDLALGYLRVLNRLSPDFFPESVELMQILAEFATGSYAYLNNRIRDYRSKFGFKAENWLIPVETTLSGKRKELTTHLLAGNLLRISEPQAFHYSVQTGIRFLGHDSVLSVLKNPALLDLLRNFGDGGCFILAASGIPASQSQILAKNGIDPDKTDLFRELLSASPDPEKTGENLMRLDLSPDKEWIEPVVIRSLFLTSKARDFQKWKDDGRVPSDRISDLRTLISPAEYEMLDTSRIQILINDGSRPVAPGDRFQLYLGLYRFHSFRKDSLLSLFFRKEALREESISPSLEALLLEDLFFTQKSAGWDAFDDYYFRIKNQFSERLRKKIVMQKMEIRAMELSSGDLQKELEIYRAEWQQDREIEDQILILSVQSLVREKKKQAALKLIKDYDKKYPKNTVSPDLRALFR